MKTVRGMDGIDSASMQSLRESGFRTLFVGIFSLAIAFILYSRLAGTSGDGPAPQQLTSLAYAILVIIPASIAAMINGSRKLFRYEQLRTAGSPGLMSIITGAFLERRTWKVMVVSAVAYAIFFGFLSQIFVYRPDLSLRESGIAVPSMQLTPCCSSPGYVPILTFYLTDHFLILIIPLNVMLAALVSTMVGFNAALAVFAFRMRKTVRAETSLVSGIGAASGLFMGCPTCAGSILSALLGAGVAGAGFSAAALGPFQTLFIAAGLPALAVAPFLLARSIRKSIACKVS